MSIKLSAAEAAKLGIEPKKKERRTKDAIEKLADQESNARQREHERAMFGQLCKAYGLPVPHFEHPFAEHLGRKFRFDYLFDGWLAVEKDGGLYGRGEPCPTCGRRAVGAHSSIKQQKADREKDRLAVKLGYSVLRFTPEEFRDCSAFVEIKEQLAAREEQS